MQNSRIIAVVGATGAQGGGLVRAILADASSGFRARAITRKANGEKAEATHALRSAAEGLVPLKVLTVGKDLVDCDGRIAERYDLQPGTAVLLRPDQHICARWSNADASSVRQAMQHALARS